MGNLRQYRQIESTFHFLIINRYNLRGKYNKTKEFFLASVRKKTQKLQGQPGDRSHKLVDQMHVKEYKKLT